MDVLHREVGSCSGGCSLREHIAINLSREYLESHQETGMTFKVSGKAGESIHALTAAYIRAFLAVAK